MLEKERGCGEGASGRCAGRAVLPHSFCAKTPRPGTVLPADCAEIQGFLLGLRKWVLSRVWLLLHTTWKTARVCAALPRTVLPG